MRAAVLVAAIALAGCGGGDEATLGLYHLERQIEGPVDGAGELVCTPDPPICPNVDEIDRDVVYAYRVQGDPVLDGDDFDRDATRPELDPQTGEPIVLLRFTASGGREFTAFTRTLARTRNAQHIAIAVDGRIVAFPLLDPLQFPDGISGENGMQITGLGSLEESRELARRIRGD